MYTKKDFLSSLKRTREEAGWTQKSVEEKLNLRPLMMRDYEVGRLKLPVSQALQLAQLYNVSLDQLVGNEPSKKVSKILTNFTPIFEGNSFSIMYLDPVIRAYIEDKRDYYFDNSLFDTITNHLNESHKKKLILEITKMLFALASADGKISDHEIETIKYILSVFQMQKNYKEIHSVESHDYSIDKISNEFKNIEVRHFLIWLLFLFAKSDGKISIEELHFIEMRSEELKVNRSNFLNIKNKFIKES
ncbi:MAG: TerB family tellurite resistance protein [Bdellovibrionales bacterium]|nr:TerB family tellurite resistance protein [Bdellovibrionales bacterium]